MGEARKRKSNLSNGNGNGNYPVAAPKRDTLQSFLLDYTLPLFFVFGGCCTNAWALESLLQGNPDVGTALTFCQLAFITIQSLPSFITLRSFVPRLKPRAVPIYRWMVQVVLLATTSLLNNWAFSYRIPLTIQIIFRSAGLVVSMIIGFVFLRRRYSRAQVLAVLIVTSGVVLATLSKPISSSKSDSAHSQRDVQTYFYGIFLLAVGLVLSGFLGLMQELTFAEYGPHWQECLFYTHALSLPIFSYFLSDVKSGLITLTKFSSRSIVGIPSLYLILLVNAASQWACVTGVNQLTSRMSSVSTNLVLTIRKAISLAMSVWLFGNGMNAGLAAGGALVLAGTLLYSKAAQQQQSPSGSTLPTRVSKTRNKKR